MARTRLSPWLSQRLPARGRSSAPTTSRCEIVLATAAKGDSLQGIALAYLDLTDVYLPRDLADDILAKANRHANSTASSPGTLIEDPARSAGAVQDRRRGTSRDGPKTSARSVASTCARTPRQGSKSYVSILDHMAERGMNAIVLDTKDTDGYVTYPSKVAIWPVRHPRPTENAADPRDLARTIRFAHARGVRVIMRISCFHDEWVQPRRTDLSVRGKWGGPYPIGWLDPSSEGAHQYVIALAKEAMDAAAPTRSSSIPRPLSGHPGPRTPTST